MKIKYLMIAGLFSVSSIIYAQVEEPVEIPAEALEMETPVEAPPPPPPPPVMKEEIEEAPPVFQSAPAPPPPPPPPPRKAHDIFKVVENMPQFPGEECATMSKTERQMCAQKEMLKFVYGNLQYPAIARENGVEGTCIVRYIVGKDGTIRDAVILRDIGAGCGQEALRVVNMMPKWVPGTQRGRPVDVYFNLPVKFKLEDKPGTYKKKKKG